MLEFDEVAQRVKQEFEHAKYWDDKRPEGSKKDKDKDVETWLFWMEQYLSEARKEATLTINKEGALKNLRRVLNLGFNCAMYHDMPGRAPKKN
jgi:hypothetical protein